MPLSRSLFAVASRATGPRAPKQQARRLLARRLISEAPHIAGGCLPTAALPTAVACEKIAQHVATSVNFIMGFSAESLLRKSENSDRICKKRNGGKYSGWNSGGNLWLGCPTGIVDSQPFTSKSHEQGSNVRHICTDCRLQRTTLLCIRRGETY